MPFADRWSSYSYLPGEANWTVLTSQTLTPVRNLVIFDIWRHDFS